MKEFSHPSTGHKQIVDVNAALSTTATVARNEWKYVADLVFDLQPDLPGVPGLRDELNQVFLNLIVNAAHAIGESKTKGKITLVLASISLAGDPDTRHRRRDPFRGSKPYIRAILYHQTGWQGHRPRPSHRPIRGCRQAPGRMFFETELNQGTTFIIQLPLQSQPLEPSGEPP